MSSRCSSSRRNLPKNKPDYFAVFGIGRNSEKHLVRPASCRCPEFRANQIDPLNIAVLISPTFWNYDQHRTCNFKKSEKHVREKDEDATSCVIHSETWSLAQPVAVVLDQVPALDAGNIICFESGGTVINCSLLLCTRLPAWIGDRIIIINMISPFLSHSTIS